LIWKPTILHPLPTPGQNTHLHTHKHAMWYLPVSKE